MGSKPFDYATPDDHFYSLIKQGEIETFFKYSQASHLSAEFKDLIVNMLAYDGRQRPTIDEIKAHPWMLRHCIRMQEASIAPNKIDI